METVREPKQIYAEWRQWTNAEAEAIAAEDWPRLAQHQARIRVLQEELHFAEQQMGQAAARTLRISLRPIVGELMEHVQCNAAALASQRANLEARRLQLTRNTQCLRQVRRAYGSEAAALWHSYS
jgi:hypothetical protein